ncbi:MAG: acyl-CoA dehydrogenase family protein, partial [Solirubrobacteraceae bacterium]|nr:acyl-CoA dehydrogenase family protein [Solirubrobacteraceae bacterium]
IRPAAQAADHDTATPKELLDQASELGVTILGVPESLGGVFGERSAVTSVLIAEALGHGDIGIAVSILAPGAVPTAIGLWGDADQQAKYLPAFTEDNAPPAALAITEPRPLFNPLKLETTATKSGDGFVLNGVKSMVPRAAEDELFVVAADLENSGPALFIVESKTEGVFTEPEPAMGLRAAATGRLVLENVRVEAGALLGGGDLAVYEECIHRSRIAWCALAVGASKAALDYLIPYVNTREAFGEPISHRQAVAFTISDIGIETDGMRLLTYRAASRADMGRTFAREAALARRQCAEKGMKIGSDAVQMLGGHGYIKEHPAERWFRDLRAVGVMEGALLV